MKFKCVLLLKHAVTSVLLFLTLASNGLYAQTVLQAISNESFLNYQQAYNYTCWNDNFLTGGITNRTFVNQTSSYNLSINFTALNMHSLNLSSTNHNQSSALAEANATTFSSLYGGDIRYAILQNGVVAYSKASSPTNTGIADSQMAEYGTWQNRRFVSTNFTNSAPVNTYFTGIEFTNWHSRFRMTFHVKPTANISNGQLQLSVDMPAAYSQYYTQGHMHAFGLSASAGFALKGGSTAATTSVTGNTIQVTTAPQNLVAGTAYEISIIFYALPNNLSTSFASIDTEESAINITAQQVLPGAMQHSVTYRADEGLHLLNLPRYGHGYFNCGQDETMQDINLSLQNTANVAKRVRLCFQHMPASNVVGYNAMIRNANGDPSGLALQASKNWHGDVPQLYSGDWNREYTEIIVPANTTINCKYTRTGAKWGETYGAFSHQLSTVGTGQSRSGWLEAGLGGYGENITHSPDYQFGNSVACDYRPFLVTSQAYGGNSGQCSWTGNVGGMDMFVYENQAGTRNHHSEVKTRFQRYSPNLTETTVSAYSADRKLKLDYTFYLNRSDDFTRVYYKLKVKALDNTTFNRFDIFQMGGDRYNLHKAQTVVYGNDQGVVNTITPINSGSNNYTGAAWALPGNNPWLWAGDGIYTNGYGGINMDTNNGMVIRSYSGTFNGVANNTPYIRERSSSIGFAGASGHNPTSYCLVPPPGVNSFTIGDSVEVLIEAMILPKQAVDYYGPNSNFATALATFGNTWQLMFREVTGNDVVVSSSSNSVINEYPIRVATVNNEANITVTGGKGYVPIIFTGLTEVNNPKLWQSDGNCWQPVDQSTWGNDFWQADYNTETGTFDLIYNVNQDRPNDATATLYYYLGDVAPDYSELVHRYNLNTVTTTQDNSVSAALGDVVVLNPTISGPSYSGGTWLWTKPNGTTVSGQTLTLNPVQLGDAGQYEVLFIDSLGCSHDLRYNLCYAPTQLIPQSNLNNTGWSINTNITLSSGSSVRFAPAVREGGTVSMGAGQWTWVGPGGYQAVGRVVTIPSTAFSGTYVYTYTNPCGGAISASFQVQTPTLPISLLHFTAVAIEQNLVRLHWSTASEWNNQGFNVERSADGQSWETLGFVAGQGSTNTENRYQYDDRTPLNGQNYYRLKQMDHDGQFEYTDIRVVDIITENKFVVYPSPTQGAVFYLGFSQPTSGRLSLYDLQGRLVYQAVLAQAQTHFEINLPKGITSGQYIVEFVNDAARFMEKLIVE
jgi:hypothetical protein